MSAELNQAQKNAMATCQTEGGAQYQTMRERCVKEVQAQGGDTQAYNSHLLGCMQTHLSEIPSNDECLKSKNVNFPAIVYEFVSHRTNPIILECSSIPHGQD